MLYFIECGIYAKIGYSKNVDTFEKRLSAYKTHNPHFRLVDITDGTKEDEQRLQSLYKMYPVDGNKEWTYAKKLATKIWVEYRASKENVDYYEEFGLSKGDWCRGDYGGILWKETQLAILQEDLITDKDIDLYTEFEQYYNKEEESDQINL